MGKRMDAKVFSRELNKQVQKLKSEVGQQMSNSLDNQLEEFCKSESLKEIERIKKVVNTKVFDRIVSIDKQLKNKNTSPEQKKNLVKELSILIHPQTVLTELNAVVTVKDTWRTYYKFYKYVSKNSMFTAILERYRVDVKVFDWYQKGLLENTPEFLNALENHTQQLHNHNDFMRKLAAARGEKQLFNLGVGLVGSFVAGPLGGIAGRKISQALTSDGESIERSAEMIDQSWEKVWEAFQTLLTKLEQEYFNIYYSLFAGYAKKVNTDLNNFGYEVVAFDSDQMSFLFGVKASEVRKIANWLQGNLKNLEAAFLKNQHSFSQTLFEKMEMYIKSNAPVGEVVINGEKVKDTIASTKFKYMLAFIEQEYWTKNNHEEALKQYTLLLEKVPIQVEQSTNFTNILLPSMLVVISRMIHLTATEFKGVKKNIYNAFYNYHSIEKETQLSSIQMIKVYELFYGFTSNKKRVALKMSEVNFKILESVYKGVLKNEGWKKDAFSSYLKMRNQRSKFRLEPIFNLYDEYRELYLRYKIIQPKYVSSLLLAAALMSNWTSFASAGKFLPGADSVYFNHIENKRIDTKLDEYALKKASDINNKERIFQLLKMETSPNVILTEGNTLLEKAILEEEDLSYIESLLTFGANPNGQRGRVPLLFLAINTQDVELVKLMLSFGAKPYLEGESGYDSLDYVSALNNSDDYYEIMLLLLNEYEKTDGYTVNKSMLKYALLENDLTALKKIFALGADANMKIDSKPLLFHAIDAGASIGIFNFLIDEGADINYANVSGENLLIYLTTHSKKKIALYEYFVAKGIDLNVQDSNGNSPLIIAAKENENNVVEFLLQAGADASLQNEKLHNALFYAFENKQFKTIELLLPVNKIDEENYFMWLEESVASREAKITALLLEQSLAKKISESDQRDLLFLSIENEDKYTLTALLDYGVNPNFVNENQVPPLEYTQKHELEGMSELLIEKGALQNLGYITSLEGYWRTGYDTVAKFYKEGERFILEEFVEGESLKYVLSDEMEIDKDNDVYKLETSNFSSIDEDGSSMYFYNNSENKIVFHRIEKDDFDNYVKEQVEKKTEQESIIAKEKMEEEERVKEENRKQSLVEAHDPLVGNWVSDEEGIDKEEIFISIRSEEEEIFIAVDGMSYTYAISLEMETTVVEGEVIRFGDPDYKGTLVSENVLTIYQEGKNRTRTYEKVE